MKEERRKKGGLKSRIRIIVGVLICAIGACIFLYPAMRDFQTNKRIEEIKESFMGALEEKGNDKSALSVDSANGKEDESTGEADTERAEAYAALMSEMQSYNESIYENGQNLTDAFSYESAPIDLKGLGGGEAIGYIEIPSINCKLPLYLGASSKNLSKGAAVMGNTSMPIGGENTNCVIAAHRGYLGSAFFRNINAIAFGDTVRVTNPWGTLIYKAVSAEVIEPTNEEPLLIEEGKDTLTLVSCHPYVIGGGSQRIVVKCERAVEESLAEQEKTDGGEQHVSNAANSTENPNAELIASDDSQSGDTLMRAENALRAALPIILIAVSILLLIGARRKK